MVIVTRAQVLTRQQLTRSEALRNLDQMKGHIAQAGQQRAERQTERQVAGATQELAAARAWAAKLEKEFADGKARFRVCFGGGSGHKHRTHTKDRPRARRPTAEREAAAAAICSFLPAVFY